MNFYQHIPQNYNQQKAYEPLVNQSFETIEVREEIPIKRCNVLRIEMKEEIKSLTNLVLRRTEINEINNNKTPNHEDQGFRKILTWHRAIFPDSNPSSILAV